MYDICQFSCCLHILPCLFAANYFTQTTIRQSWWGPCLSDLIYYVSTVTFLFICVFKDGQSWVFSRARHSMLLADLLLWATYTNDQPLPNNLWRKQGTFGVVLFRIVNKPFRKADGVDLPMSAPRPARHVFFSHTSIMTAMSTRHIVQMRIPFKHYIGTHWGSRHVKKKYRSSHAEYYGASW